MLAVFAASLLSIVLTRAHVRWQTPLTWPWAAWIAASLAAAILGAHDRPNAVHMTGRIVLAFAIFLLTVNATAPPRRVRMAVVATAVAGLIVSGLVIAEYAGLTPALR